MTTTKPKSDFLVAEEIPTIIRDHNKPDQKRMAQ